MYTLSISQDGVKQHLAKANNFEFLQHKLGLFSVLHIVKKQVSLRKGRVITFSLYFFNLLGNALHIALHETGIRYLLNSTKQVTFQ